MKCPRRMTAKIDRLMALATHPNTPTEEARTAAMAAVKLIQSQGLLAKAPAPESRPQGASGPWTHTWSHEPNWPGDAYSRERERARREYREAAAKVRKRHPDAPVSPAFAHASSSGRCESCSEKYESGDAIATYGTRTTHADCWKYFI